MVEGVGDRGCEHMTGGEALIIGPDWTQPGSRHVGRSLGCWTCVLEVLNTEYMPMRSR